MRRAPDAGAGLGELAPRGRHQPHSRSLTMTTRECRVELLIGRRVVDASGEVVGRLEEIVADYLDDEYVVREFHVGAFAALERLGTGRLGRSLLRLIGGDRIYTGYIVPWRHLDLSD